jgi:hypothetical protein
MTPDELSALQESITRQILADLRLVSPIPRNAVLNATLLLLTAAVVAIGAWHEGMAGIRAFAANGARTANFDANNDLVFDKGTVDFPPVRSITPGPVGAEFPPVAFQPGAVGDANYSPLVQVLKAGGVIYNAPIVAFDVNASDITFPNGNVIIPGCTMRWLG